MQGPLVNYPLLCYCPQMTLDFLTTELTHLFPPLPQSLLGHPCHWIQTLLQYLKFISPYFLALNKTHFAGRHHLLVTLSNGNCTFLYIHHYHSHKQCLHFHWYSSSSKLLFFTLCKEPFLWVPGHPDQIFFCTPPVIFTNTSIFVLTNTEEPSFKTL